MCPYIIVAALPQTNNAVNDWGMEIIQACTSAAAEAKNAVLLNVATDGVKSETSQNLQLMCAFLDGKSNVLALVDTNHNIKNSRGQIVGGGSAACIGKHVIDPSMFKRACVPKEVVRLVDFASDKLPLALASSKVVKSLLDLGSEDPGNVLVSHYLFMVLCLFQSVLTFCLSRSLSYHSCSFKCGLLLSMASQ
jgi:hypothetical protein